MLGKSAHTPLVTLIVLICCQVCLVLFILLVNGKVSQVGVFVIFNGLLVVGLTGKPGQTLIVNIKAPRVHAGHKDVQADVKLKAVDKKRVVDVPTHDALLVDGGV